MQWIMCGKEKEESVTVCCQLESPVIPKRVGEMVGFVLLRKINNLFLFIKTVKNRTYVVKVPQWAFELTILFLVPCVSNLLWRTKGKITCLTITKLSFS